MSAVPTPARNDREGALAGVGSSRTHTEAQPGENDVAHNAATQAARRNAVRTWIASLIRSFPSEIRLTRQSAHSYRLPSDDELE